MAGGKKRLVIFDTTLRDGEQSPGASMNLAQKLEVAHALDLLGVDVIEAGFPITSRDDFEAVQTIGRQVRRPTICGLARCVEKDIVAAGEALKTAARKRIHVFLATSAIHRKYKLHKARSEIIRMAVAGVKRARKFTADVQFSPEDAARTEPDFLAQVVEAVIEAGATTVNIPDTVGYTLPWHFEELIAGLYREVSNIRQAVIAIHCHNDLGLAVANTLAAVRAGARQIECTINGLGERAGNCSLEEVVMAVKTRSDEFVGVTSGIKTRRLYPTSRLVSRITGLAVQRNKAIVGENAFAHEAGIHQDGMLKERTTYEIMRPEDVGFKRTSLVLGKHSGRHALAARMKQLGFKLSRGQLEIIFERFKTLADRKKEIFDEDLEALAETELYASTEFWRLASMHVSSGTSAIPMATVELVDEKGKTSCDASTGDGPVDAIFRAIERLTGLDLHLEDYQIRSVTGGKEAQGEVRVGVRYRNMVISGRGVSTDVLEASARAYVDATNRLLSRQRRAKTTRKRTTKKKGK
ncbi:MAG: 2-isopropylmalate synthase [Anaerolineaceae bacterium]|nr:2-isopropylmalate synthase [Anaerolineaceae bacterium]